MRHLPAEVRLIHGDDAARQAIAERLRALQWWRFGMEVLHPLDVRDPERFADRLEARLAGDDPPAPFAPAPMTYEDIIATEART